MKDHVEIGHLTKYAFRVNRDQAMDLEYGSKSIQTSLAPCYNLPSMIFENSFFRTATHKA